MSIFQPPPGFPPQLAIIWPLIWAQILVLRALMRAKYGKGVEYRWSVTLCGRVFLTSIDWIPGEPRKPDWLKDCGARITAAINGDLMMPAYARAKPLSLGRGVGVRGHVIAARAVLADTPSPLIPNPFSPRRRGLPLPLPDS